MSDVLKGRTLAVIGCGAMGSALLRGLVTSGATRPDQIIACDIDPRRLEEPRKMGCHVSGDNRSAVQRSDIVLLAVKPQVIDEVVKELAPLIDSDRHLIISIAAGISLSRLETLLPENTPIVRVMPNTPAQVLEGASALSFNAFVKENQREVARAIFSSAGSVVELDEKYLDAVTALSGSGPAYVFLFIEALADGGVRVGLSRDIALTLAVQTVLGAAKMVRETKAHPGVLKDQVASPGGTTIAALAVLEGRGLRGAVIEAVWSAYQRAKELSGH